MIGDKMNISKIESYLHGKMKNVVSSQCFAGTLPETIKDSWNDMCLICCDSGIEDRNCFGEGIVYVFLFSKPFKDGSKNVNRMNTLETNLNNAIAATYSDGEGYRISRKSTRSDFSQSVKWHYNVVELIIKIV